MHPGKKATVFLVRASWPYLSDTGDAPVLRVRAGNFFGQNAPFGGSICSILAKPGDRYLNKPDRRRSEYKPIVSIIRTGRRINFKRMGWVKIWKKIHWSRRD